MDDDLKRLNERTHKSWEANAEGWDTKMAEGNGFFRELIWPSTERLLCLTEGSRVLDAACGNGTAARRMSALGAEVSAFDFSAGLVERARARGEGGITYAVGDATDVDFLSKFGDGAYDAVHSSSVLAEYSSRRHGSCSR